MTPTEKVQSYIQALEEVHRVSEEFVVAATTNPNYGNYYPPNYFTLGDLKAVLALAAVTERMQRVVLPKGDDE